jgi:hypothetical protein
MPNKQYIEMAQEWLRRLLRIVPEKSEKYREGANLWKELHEDFL